MPAAQTIVPRFGNCFCTETRVGRVAFPVADSYLYDALTLTGDYCFGEMIVQERLVKPGMTVLDVGANIGLMSLNLSQLVGNSGSVQAFEPSPFAHGLLRHNINVNGRGNVRPVRAAISDWVGQTEFADPDAEVIERFNFGILSLDSRFAEVGGRGQNVDTDVLTIDSLRLEKCDFIKVDVEGFEAAVVRGAVETIERCRPSLSLEVGESGKDVSWVSFLRELGYRIFVISTLVFSAPNFKGGSIRALPSVICANAFALPPGKDHNELLGNIYRKEVRSVEGLIEVNAGFVKHDLEAAMQG